MGSFDRRGTRPPARFCRRGKEAEMSETVTIEEPRFARLLFNSRQGALIWLVVVVGLPVAARGVGEGHRDLRWHLRLALRVHQRVLAAVLRRSEGLRGIRDQGGGY